MSAAETGAPAINDSNIRTSLNASSPPNSYRLRSLLTAAVGAAACKNRRGDTAADAYLPVPYGHRAVPPARSFEAAETLRSYLPDAFRLDDTIRISAAHSDGAGARPTCTAAVALGGHPSR